MGDPHLAALRTEFTAEGWSGEIEVESALDGDVTNAGVARYRDLAGRHLTHVHTGAPSAGHRVAALPHQHLRHPDRPAPPVPGGTARRHTAPSRRTRTTGAPSSCSRSPSPPGRTVTVDKTVALHTSRDPAISDPLHAAVDRVGRAAGLRGAAGLAPLGLGTAVAAGASWRCPARRADPATAPLPRAADALPAHRRPRRRRPGPRPARRGVPGPRLLGRAVRPALS